MLHVVHLKVSLYISPGSVSVLDQNLRLFLFVILQMREEGVGALFKGLTPVMLRAFPANAVSSL